MNPRPPASLSPKHDVQAIRSLVLRLTALQKAVCAAVVLVIALVVYRLLASMLGFGLGINYHSLLGVSADTNALLQQYLPWLWWGLAVLLALIVIHALYRYALASHRRSQQRVVNAQAFAQLADQLSPEGREVLGWAWENRRYPVTVGILQRTLRELHAGRAGQIDLARTHADSLAQAKPKAEPSLPTSHSPLL